MHPSVTSLSGSSVPGAMQIDIICNAIAIATNIVTNSLLFIIITTFYSLKCF